MLTEIAVNFPSSDVARKCLTAFRKQYRVALRGAVAGSVTSPSGMGLVGRVWVELGNTGFSAAEFGSAIGAILARLEA
jgi:hypothetical protein